MTSFPRPHRPDFLSVAKVAALAFAAFILSPAAVRATDQVDELSVVTSWRMLENRNNPGSLEPFLIADINGDGYPDWVLGAPTAPDLATINTGIVYIRFGGSHATLTDYAARTYDLTSSSTLTTNPVLSHVNFADVYSTPLPSGCQLRAPVAGQRFGSTLAAADFDGDGITDLAIGAPGPTSGATSPGRVYLLKGRGGLSGLVNVTTELTNGRAAYVEGLSIGDGTGTAGRTALADVDGDGLSDLMMGFPNAGTGGKVYVIGGRAIGALGQGSVDTVPPPLAEIDSIVAGEKFGATVAGGDLNGDYRSEVIAAAINTTNPGGSRGRVVAITYPGMINGQLQVDFYPGDQLSVELPGTAAPFGVSIAVGNSDGDTTGDLAIGLPYAPPSPAPVQKGAVYVVKNVWDRRDPISSIFTLSTATANWSAVGVQDSERFGWTLKFADVAVNSFDELIIGAPGYEYSSRPQAGAVFVSDVPSTATSTGTVVATWRRAVLGAKAFDRVGTNVDAADYDGDGYADLFAGLASSATYNLSCPSWTWCFLSGEGVRVYGLPYQTSTPGPLPEELTGASAQWMRREE